MKINRFLFAILFLALLAVSIQAQNLRPGEAIDREITGNETHLYKINLQKDQFIQIRVDKKGANVALRLVNTKGETLATMDNPNGAQEPGFLEFIAGVAGEYILEVANLEKTGQKGNYSIKWAEARTAIDFDRKRVLADHNLKEVVEILNNPTLETLKASVAKLEIAQSLYREIGNKNNQAYSLMNLGTVNKMLGERQKAIDSYNQALSLFRTINNKEGETTTLNNLGALYSSIGEQQEALNYFNQALSLVRETKNKNSEAAILNGIANIYLVKGDSEQAIVYFNQALSLIREIGNTRGEMAISNGLASAYSSKGEKQKALNYYKQALGLAQKNGDARGEAIILASMGRTYSTLGERELALFHYDQALPKLKIAGDANGVAQVQSAIGTEFFSLGDNENALSYYNRALPMLKASGDKNSTAYTLNRIGDVYKLLGEMYKALAYYKDADSLFKAVGNKRGEAMVLNNTGDLYNSLGEIQTALDNYKKALDIVKAIKDVPGEVATLNNIATQYILLRNKQEALNNFNEALSKLKATEDTNGEASTLNNIAGLYDTFNDTQKALDNYKDALFLFRKVGNKNGEATTLSGIGKINSVLGNQQEALNYYHQCLPLFRAVGNKKGEAIVLHHSMAAWNALKKQRLAIFYGKQSVNAFQQLRGKNQFPEDSQLQKSFVKSVEYSYRELADLLIYQGRLDEALQVLNSLKDQEYFDYNPLVRRQYEPLKLTGRESKYEALYSQKSELVGGIGREIERLKRNIGSRQPTAEEAEQLKKLEANLEAASKEFSAVLKQAETEYSKAPDDQDKAEGIPDTMEMQTALRDLQFQTKKKVVAIYTLIGEDKFSALIVTPNNMVSVFSPIKGRLLKQKAVNLWEQVSKIDPQTNLPKFPQSEVQKSGKELYDMIFAQIDAKLKQLKFNPDVVMWSLDGALRYIPVNALYDNKQYLAERYHNVVFTRANAKRMLASGTQNWTGSGFYNSKESSLAVNGKIVGFRGLINAKSEVETIFGIPPKQGIIGGEFMPDEKFTKESLLKALKLNRPLVHIASHFRFEAGDSSTSFLVLGDGSKLTLEDIKNEPDDLFKGVELLTLSACETGVQKERESDGREIDGFGELAQRKGAGAVIASLWKVDDESTSQLMTQFYQTRQIYKIPKIEALRKAQLSLLKSKNYSHPYYWSSFILIGNWR